jgi:hypothetical protein
MAGNIVNNVCQQDEHAGAWAMRTQQWATMKKHCTSQASIWKYQQRLAHLTLALIV